MKKVIKKIEKVARRETCIKEGWSHPILSHRSKPEDSLNWINRSMEGCF